MRERRAKVTISEVARLAEVSVATVSAVMNGTVKVSPVRTEQVRRAMSALNYRPDERGRSLRTGRSRLIGVVVPDVTNPFYPAILRDIEHAARQRGYSVLLCDSANDPEQERRHLEALYGRRVDGALVACTDSRTSYEWAEDRGFPVVFFERIPLSGRFSAVSTDHAAAAAEATRHFLALGHRRIAFLVTNETLSSNAARLAGFRAEMEAWGVAVHSELLRTGVEDASAASAIALELSSIEQRPTAILATNSVLLLGVLSGARKAGLRCPRDVSLICFDNPIWTEHFDPPCTTMAQPTEAIAKEAVRLLVEWVSEDRRKTGVVRLKDRLVLRGSTAPPPGR